MFENIEKLLFVNLFSKFYFYETLLSLTEPISL